jgi:DNA repair exonuclease SbcCD ATPase subunit
MTPTVATDPGLQQQHLRQRLAAIRRRRRFVILFRGTCWLLTLVLATALVAGLLDWRFHTPSVIRALFLVGGLAGAGVLFYRRLFLPLREKDDDLTLALRIEELYPGLNDSFASAVEFLDTPDENNSQVMRREAVHRGLRGVSRCDFSRLVNTRGLWRLAALAAVPFLALVGLGVWEPGLTGVAFARLVDPFGSHAWPTKTRIALDEVRASIGHNEPFDVSGQLFGVIPETAVVIFKLDTTSQIEDAPRVAVADDGKSGTFHVRLEAGRAKRDTFLFQVRANDAVTEWQKITVLPPPQLVPLDGHASPQVLLTFPGYTQLPALPLPEGSGKVDAVNGTVVTLRAAANRPLSAAWIEFRPEPPSVSTDLLLSPLASSDPVGAAATLAGWRSVSEPVPAILSEDRRTLSVTFTPPVSGNYVLHFADDTGLRNNRMFELNVFADPSPVVALERPAPARDNLIVLPDATLELQVTAEDQQFAVRHIWLEYRCKKTDEPRRLKLFAPGPEVKERPQRVPINRRLALKEFRHINPAEGALKEGDVLTIQACADDFDDVSAGKEPGRSHEIEIRIVSQNALELLINNAQARVQQELVILKQKQQEATKKVSDVQQQLKQNGKLSPDELDKLVQAEETQREVRDAVGDKKEGLRAEVARIRQTLRENPLPRSGSEKRMERVGDELDRLARDELPQIEPRLTNARKQDDAGKQNKPDKATARAQAEQKEREAKEAERQAREQEKAAAAAERAAETKPQDDPQRRRLEDEAAEQRKSAEANRDKARELNDQARELRQQADGPKQLLQEAKQHQEEVEKTLDDLLKNALDSFTSTQEVKGEAKALLEDQKKLQQQTAELQQKQLAGIKPQAKQEFEAALERLKTEQQKLRERTEQLLEKMDRVAKEREQRDPDTAREMKDAAQLGRDSQITSSMQEAQDNLKADQPQLGKAAEKEAESVRKLEELAKQLSDRREAELNRAARSLREEEKKLQELQEEMERLRKKMQEAEKIEDPKKREEELQRLAREQKKLEEEAKQAAQRLTRHRSPRAAQAMQKAAEEMQRASEQLSRGKDAQEQEQEALDRLQEAREELKKAREEVEEELEREQLAKVADEIKAMRDRQAALIAERERIYKEMLLQRPDFWRPVLISLGDLARNQGKEGLAKDLSELAKKKLEGAPVFSRLLQKTGDVMEDAAQRLKDHREQAKDGGKPESEAGTDAARLQKEALARLEGVLQTLKEEQNAPMGGGGGGGGGGGAGGGGDGSEIPPLAQLKLLRQMQVDVNKQTEDFRKAHPDLTKLDDKSKTELQQIRRAQQEVAELLDELLDPGEGGGDKP